MRKIFLILAIAIGALTFGASAQECAKVNACKEVAKCKQECPSTKGDCKVSMCHDILLKGITLTAAQKTELETLKNTCNTECTKTQTCENGKKVCKEGSKKKFDGAIKKILTPEQYAIFVTNTKMLNAKKCTKQVSKCCKK